MEEKWQDFYSKREIIQMELVDEKDYTEDVIVCIPRFSWDVARSLLGWYGKWRTSYAMEYRQGGYRLPDDTEFDVIEASLDNFLGARDMACDIKEGLDCICNAVNELAAATLAGNVGSNYLPANDQQPSEFEDDTVSFPPEFTDRTEYESHKCNMAETVYQDILADFQTMATLDLFALGGALALAPFLVTGIPGALLVIGYGILATSLIAGTTFFNEVATRMGEVKADLVCGLYTAADIESARNSFINTLADNPNWTSSLFNGTAQQAMQVWLNWTNLNPLFGAPDGRVLATGDCSGCEQGCPPFYIATGALVAQGTNQVTVLSVLSSGSYRVNINFNNPTNSTATYCGPAVTINAVVPSQTPSKYGGSWIYRGFNQSHVEKYSSDSPPVDENNIGWLAINATQPIEYQITWTDD